MKIAEVENLPDQLEPGEIQRYCFVILDDSDKHAPLEVLQMLSELGDRQWHTYGLPTELLRDRIENWIRANWQEDSQHFLEELLAAGYVFGIDKGLYAQALELYRGEHLEEFKRNLDKSAGPYIDPFWSLRVDGEST